MTVTLSATLAGSVFGDHCSPISDTTHPVLFRGRLQPHPACGHPDPLCLCGGRLLLRGLPGCRFSGGSALLTLVTGIGLLLLSLFLLHRRAKMRLAK